MRRLESFLCRSVWRPMLVAAPFVLLLVPLRDLRAQERTVPSFLSLQEAVDIALEGSTQLGSQEARLQATRSRKTSAWLNLGPNVSVSAFKSRQTRTDFDLDPDGPGPQKAIDFVEPSGFRQFQTTSDVTLFDGGSNWARLAAAKSDVRAGELDLEYTKSTVAEAVIEAYYGLMRAKLLETVAEEAVVVSKEQLERTQALYDLGSAARSDVLKSQVQLGQTRLELVQARNRTQQAHDDLVFSMNLVTSTSFDIDTTIADLPDEEVDFQRVKAHALAQRPDLLSLRETEKAEGRRVWVARGPLWPSISFRYSYSRSDQESERRFGAANTSNRSWNISGSWNIFDRWQTYSNISNAKAQKRVAEYNRKQAELDAVRELRTHVNSLREAKERLKLARENVERSEEDLRLAQEKFRVGAGTILDTITAESDLSSTKGEVVQAIVDFFIARAKLARASGLPFDEL